MRRGFLALPIVLCAVLAVVLPQRAFSQASGGSGYDSSMPVQINADSLGVQPDKEGAGFKGNVDATQGDLRLKTDLLRVFYTETPQGERKAGDVRHSSMTVSTSSSMVSSRPP